MSFRIAILTNIIPNYRKGFYDRLLSIPNFNVTIYVQEKLPNSNVKSIHKNYPDNVKLIRSRWFVRLNVTWQFIPYKEIFCNFNIVIVDGNLRHLSQFLFSVFLRILGKKVIIWSVGHSRNNKFLNIKTRLYLWRFFNNFLMYNQRDVDYLKANGFERKFITSINNALDQKKIEDEKFHWDDHKLRCWQAEIGIVLPGPED